MTLGPRNKAYTKAGTRIGASFVRGGCATTATKTQLLLLQLPPPVQTIMLVLICLFGEALDDLIPLLFLSELLSTQLSVGTLPKA